MTRAITLVVGSSLAAVTAVRADTLAHWTYESSLPSGLNMQDAGPYAAELGLNAAGSFASGHHAIVGTDYNNPVGNGSHESFSSNGWKIGDYYQFTTSTIGYKNIMFGWDQTRSPDGPVMFDLAYSLDGVNFTIMLDDFTVLLNDPINGGSWNMNTYRPNYTFAPIGALNPSDLVNQPLVYFRLTSQLDGTHSLGTNRVDDVMILGEVPAPGCAALLGLAGLTVAKRRR